MSLVAVAVVGAGVAGAAISANAASDASDAQLQAAQEGQETQLHMFEQVQALLSPYAEAGEESLSAQMGLIGLNGQAEQQQAINSLEQSAGFQSLLQQGENSILQNASATGGLRGGNTQAALAQFSPQLLNQQIQQQYGNLGGITALGQNAAAGTGNAATQTGANVANLQQQAGAAVAGGAIAQGQAINQGLNSVVGGLATYQGLTGF